MKLILIEAAVLERAAVALRGRVKKLEELLEMEGPGLMRTRLEEILKADEEALGEVRLRLANGRREGAEYARDLKGAEGRGPGA